MVDFSKPIKTVSGLTASFIRKETIVSITDLNGRETYLSYYEDGTNSYGNDSYDLVNVYSDYHMRGDIPNIPPVYPIGIGFNVNRSLWLSDGTNVKFCQQRKSDGDIMVELPDGSHHIFHGDTGKCVSGLSLCLLGFKTL